MATINFELRDSSVAVLSSVLSIKELKALSQPARVQALQRYFLYFGDILRQNEIDTADIVGALVAAAGQDFIENDLEPAVASAVDGDAFQAAFKSLHGFSRAVAIMLIRQGSLGPTTGVAMTYAAVGGAQENAGAKTTSLPDRAGSVAA